MANPTNYKKYSIILDADVPEENKLIEWIERHKGKRNSFASILRKALTKYIEILEAENG